MKKVRVAVLGLGNFGHSWADTIVPACGEAELVAVIDRNESHWQGIPESVPRFRDLASACEATHPELVVNVTPPVSHHEINAEFLRRGIAVLCEKPIADTLEAADATGAVLSETKGFLMIGENYRYQPIFRRAKELLTSGRLGRIHTIDCHFRHYHPDVSRFYHGTLTHPLLDDVSIHHLDLARYLSGEEAQRVWCQEHDAPYSWYGARYADAWLMAEMSGDVRFRYDGTLGSPATSTHWNGEWEIECDYGVLQIRGEELILHLPEDRVEREYFPDALVESRVLELQEACIALRENRPAETDYADNRKSFLFLQLALRAAEAGDWIDA